MYLLGNEARSYSDRARSVDALRPIGIHDIVMPCTPERVWKAIQSAGAHDGESTAEAQPHFDEATPNNADPGSTGEGNAQ